jgi:AraC-like DNA-binding protein
VATDYRERPPAASLRRHLSCVWWRAVPEGPPPVVRVVPDACVDVVWRSDGRLQVAGPDTRPAPVVAPAGVRYAGVRFLPGTAPALLDVPADLLRDLRVDLADLWGAGPAGRLLERLWAAPDPAAALEAAFAERLPAAAAIDPLAPVLARFRSRPSGGLPALAGDLGLSERQLRRRCEAAFGYGPRTLERVLRFRRFLALAADREASLADLALAAGYADQAHLNRECRRLAGATPAALQQP